MRVQSGFCSKENEYKCDCTSQPQPGELFTRQVPPTPASFSNSRKSCSPSCFRRMAMPRPEKPVPIMATLQWRVAEGGETGAFMAKLLLCLLLAYTAVYQGRQMYTRQQAAFSQANF